MAAPAWIWLPALVVAIAVLLPPVYLLVRSMGAGLVLWQELFSRHTGEILLRTALLVVTVTGCSTVVSLPLAWLTVRTELPGRRIWSVLTALPLAIPSYVGALAIIAALGPRGILQQWLEGPLGVTRLPSIYGFPGAVLTLTLLSYPYMLLSIRAGLWGLDTSLEEASRSLGRGPVKTFFRIVLPQLAPSIAAGALLVALYTLSDFGAVSLLRFDTFTSAIYLQYQTSFDRTLAAGLSLVLVAMTLGILLLETSARSRARYYRSSAGSSRTGKQASLGPWQWPALLFCVVTVTASLGIPLAVLGYWLLRGLRAGERMSVLWEPMVNSLSVSALAAGVCVVTGLPIAVYSIRFQNRVSTLAERASYIGFGLPGIVVALALVFFATRYARPFYQTLPLLLFAYLVLFLPQAVGALRNGVLQVKPALEEAGRSLGKRPWAVLWTITLPLLRSGLVGAAGLVFLTTMKELPATLVLGPIGFETLATRIWSATDNAFFARAAAPALLLVVVSGFPMGLLLWSERGMRR